MVHGASSWNFWQILMHAKLRASTAIFKDMIRNLLDS